MGNKTTPNFTPLIDVVTADVGLVASAVYGVVWRYCQMSGHCCTQSLATIAARAGVDRRTVIRCLKLLCARGYLRDHGAAKRTHPHRYTLTEKVALQISLTGNDAVTPDETASAGDTQSPVLVTRRHQRASAGDRESPIGDTQSPVLVTESHRTGDRESPKETLQETPEDRIKQQSEGGVGGTAAAPATPALVWEIIPVYENEIGLATPKIRDCIRDLVRDGATLAMFEYAFREAAANNARNLAYVAAIVRRLLVEGWGEAKPRASPNGRNRGDKPRPQPGDPEHYGDVLTRALRAQGEDV